MSSVTSPVTVWVDDVMHGTWCAGCRAHVPKTCHQGATWDLTINGLSTGASPETLGPADEFPNWPLNTLAPGDD